MANELEYISQYEGTEIDAAVAFGKAPDSVPTPNSEVGVESGGVETKLSGKKSRRNLLINPCCKINQLDGFVIPPNTTVFEIGNTSNTWVTDKYYQADFYLQTAQSPASIEPCFSANGKTWGCSSDLLIEGFAFDGGAPSNYTFDGWVAYNNSTTEQFTILKIDGQIQTRGVAGCNFIQRIPLDEIPLGETVTFSVLKPNGTLVVGTGTVPTSLTNDWQLICVGDTDTDFAFYVCPSNYAGENVYNLDFWNSKDFIYAKLEIGDTSTLLEEIANGDYDIELDLEKCRGYFQRIKSLNPYGYTVIGSLWAYTGDSGLFNIPLPTPLRQKKESVRPRIIAKGNLIFVGNGTRNDVGVQSIVRFDDNYGTTSILSGDFTLDSGYFTTNNSYDISLGGTVYSYIDVNSRL